MSSEIRNLATSTGIIPYKRTKIKARIHEIHQQRQYRHTLDNVTALSYPEVKSRTGEEIGLAYLRGEQVLIDAPPASGKTIEAIEQCKETDIFVIYLTARRDLYTQAEEIAQETGLKFETLPSFFEDCPSCKGKEGDAIKAEVRRSYQMGMRPSEIHEKYDLPCEEDGLCPSRKKWDFDPAEVPLLIGAYEHAFVKPIVKDRAVVIDEFPQNRFETKIENAPPIISKYLSHKNNLPWNDYISLINNRNATPDIPSHRDVTGVMETVGNQPYHTLAPLMTKALFEATNLQNGFEVCFPSWSSINAIVHDRKKSQIYILNTPDLSEAHAVVGLDGTPVPEMWNLLVDDLEKKQVLTNQEKKEYISNIQGYSIIQTTNNRQPYTSGKWAKPAKDAGLFKAIAKKHEQKPVLIAPKRTIEEYRSKNCLKFISKYTKASEVLSSNVHASDELGVIAGSRHYGDDFVKKWGAYAGEAIQRQGTGPNGPNYGSLGNQIRQYMNNQTLQEVLRFGRSPDVSPTVYVHTSVLPSWVPVESGPNECEIHVWTEKQEGTIEALLDLERAGTSEIMEHVAVSYQSQRGLRKCLNTLQESGLASRSDTGSGYVWEATEEIRTPVHVELP